jgi:hypothetical protein
MQTTWLQRPLPLIPAPEQDYSTEFISKEFHFSLPYRILDRFEPNIYFCVPLLLLGPKKRRHFTHLQFSTSLRQP